MALDASPDEASQATDARSQTAGGVREDVCRRIFSRRLIAARKLSGLDQQDAATRLGYANSSQLSKLEGCQSGLRLNILQQASLVYGVSSDYLLGLSDYPERDAATAEQLAVMRSVRQQVLDATQNLLRGIVTSGSDSAALLGHIARQRDAAGDAWRAMCEFEAEFDAGLDTCPELDSLEPETRGLIRRTLNREFAAAFTTFKRSLEASLECSEKAHRYLKRRGALRAGTYLDDVEQTYPMFAPAQDGLLGALQTLKETEPPPEPK